MAGEKIETTTPLIAYYKETWGKLTEDLSHALEFKRSQNSKWESYQTLAFNGVEFGINTSHMSASERKLLKDLIITAVLHTETLWKLGKLRASIQNAVVPAFELKAWPAIAIEDGKLTNTTLISENMYRKLFPNPGLNAELPYEAWAHIMQDKMIAFLNTILTQRNIKDSWTMLASKK